MTREAIAEADRGEITRREFLGWGLGSLGCLALPWRWEPASPPRLGLVGLGTRMAPLLTQGCGAFLGIVALCDLRPDRLRDSARRVRPRVGLLTTEAAELFAASTIDTVVVGVAGSQGIELARQACAAGKDVFLLRPLEHEGELQLLARDAERAGRVVHLSRRSAIPLDRARSLALIADRAADVRRVEVHAEVEPHSRSAAARLDPLLDDLDFARQIVGEDLGLVFDLAGEAIAPGTRPVRQRMYRTVTGGRRRELLVRETAVARRRDAGESRIILAGPRGLAELRGQAANLAADLAHFLATRGEAERQGGLALSRALRLFAVH